MLILPNAFWGAVSGVTPPPRILYPGHTARAVPIQPNLRFEAPAPWVYDAIHYQIKDVVAPWREPHYDSGEIAYSASLALPAQAALSRNSAYMLRVRARSGNFWSGWSEEHVFFSRFPHGEMLFDTVGNHRWVVPPEVTMIHALAIGSGGAGSTDFLDYRSGGYTPRGGQSGALAWVNMIRVTPGQTITVNIPASETRWGGAYAATTSITVSGRGSISAPGGAHGRHSSYYERNSRNASVSTYLRVRDQYSVSEGRRSGGAPQIDVYPSFRPDRHPPDNGYHTMRRFRVPPAPSGESILGATFPTGRWYSMPSDGGYVDIVVPGAPRIYRSNEPFGWLQSRYPDAASGLGGARVMRIWRENTDIDPSIPGPEVNRSIMVGQAASFPGSGGGAGGSLTKGHIEYFAGQYHIDDRYTSANYGGGRGAPGLAMFMWGPGKNFPNEVGEVE